MTMNSVSRGAPKRFRAALITGLAFAALPFATLHASEHGAHTHGISQLDIALSGKDLEIGYTVPGADVVGFEHPARSAKEKAAVAAAIGRLEKADTLFSLPGAADCRLAKAEVKATGLTDAHNEPHHDESHRGEGDHHKEDHAHEKDAHSKGEAREHAHEHEGERDGKDSHHEHHEEGGGDHHAEFQGHYRFHCEAPGRLDGIEIKVFKTFPSITRINARVITPRGQSAKAVTAQSPRIDF